jgi:hypothetical protein
MFIYPLDELETSNFFGIDDFSYIMYLPSDESMTGVVALYIYFFLSFIMQLSIMLDNYYQNKPLQVKFNIKHLLFIINNILLFNRNNKAAVFTSILVIMIFRYLFYCLFGVLDTYNAITVVIFIVSHYWFIMIIKKKIFFFFNRAEYDLSSGVYKSINAKNYLCFLVIFVIGRFFYSYFFTSFNYGILLFASKDAQVSTSTDITFDFNKIDDLLKKLQKNIGETHKVSESKALSDLNESIVKLRK